MAKNSKPHRNPPSKTWSGRFSVPIAQSVKEYTASVTFDHVLAEFDIQGSQAHAQMLHEAQIISAADLKAIQKGLSTILTDIRAGDFKWNLDDEDVHLNIERHLTALAGDDAVEHFEFNVSGSYAGKRTPIWCYDNFYNTML